MVFLYAAQHNPPILHPHRHEELECNIVMEGEITYVLGMARYTLKQGDMIWLFPHQKHQLIDRSSDAQIIVIVFKPHLLRQLESNTRYRLLVNKDLWPKDQVLLYTALTKQKLSLLSDVVRTFLPLSTKQRSLEPSHFGDGNYRGYGSYYHENPQWLNAGLFYVLMLCWGMGSDPSCYEQSAPVMHPSVRRALDLLEQSQGALGGESLAIQCGVSRSHLHKIFHQQTGSTIKRYSQLLKLSAFWSYYQSEHAPTLIEAAYHAGFGSYSQFYRVFFQCYGVAPRSLVNQEK